MARCVFFINPFYGHINPTLSLVKELVNSDEEVIYYSLNKFKDLVEGAGAIYKEYHKRYGNSIFNWDRIDDPAKERGDNRLLEYHYGKHSFIFTDSCKQIVDDFVEQLADIKVDYIIYDYFDAVWGKQVALKLGIPAISTVPSFAISKKMVERISDEQFQNQYLRLSGMQAGELGADRKERSNW